jgi:UDPglucose 6-dehydrogenase
MRVAMIGTGYVGLVSGACMADFGHHVVCVDKDTEKIEKLGRGEIPIYEPGLHDLVGANVRQGRLKFTTNLGETVRTAEAVFIAVGTPSRRGDGHADLAYVQEAAREIAAALEGFTVVIVKSTVPVGTGDEVERIIAEAAPKKDAAVASNPEFLREGAKHPDRIVVGADDDRAREIVAEIYRPLSLNLPPILYTSRRNAELIKYAANAFLATKITFINEIADLCEKVGGDVQEVARGIGLDKRIGSKFLHSGPGFGGSCFPKDVRALIKTAQDYDVPLRILEAVASVNETRKRAMARKVAVTFTDGVRGKTIAVLGLAFKPNTDESLRGFARFKETIARPRQAEIFAQRPALVFAAEQPAALQLRHDQADEIVEPAGQIWEHDREAVARLGSAAIPPFRRRWFRRADHGEAGIAAEPLRELPHGELFPRRHRDHPLARALAGVAFGDFGQRLIRIESAKRRGRARSTMRRWRCRSGPGCRASPASRALLRRCRRRRRSRPA